MNSRTVWLGHTAQGNRLGFDPAASKNTLFVASRCDSLLCGVAAAAAAGGATVTVFDMDGRLTDGLSGHIPARDAGSVLADSLSIAEASGARHAELIASAYSVLLGLPLQQELLVSAAVQQIALESGVGSPSAIYSIVGSVTGFRSADKQDVEGKLAALSLLDRTGGATTAEEVAASSSVVDFSGVPSAALADGAALLLLAKMTAASTLPDVAVLADAQRLFPARRRDDSRCALREALLDSPGARVMSATRAGLLDDGVLAACQCRVWSSEAWNQRSPERRLVRGTFALLDVAGGSVEVLVPRSFDPRRGERLAEPEQPAQPPEDRELALLILRSLAEGTKGTRQSMVSFYSADHPAWLVAAVVDRLVREGAVVMSKEGKEAGRVDITITEVGRRMLEEAAGVE